MANEQALILRDNDGNYYVIGTEVINRSRVTEEQKQALEGALKGDVSGFLFDTAFLSNLTNVAQSNNASANNVGVGFFVGPQTIAQIQGNQANIGTFQSANP
jgi:hypothetical protein